MKVIEINNQKFIGDIVVDNIAYATKIDFEGESSYTVVFPDGKSVEVDAGQYETIKDYLEGNEQPVINGVEVEKEYLDWALAHNKTYDYNNGTSDYYVYNYEGTLYVQPLQRDITLIINYNPGNDIYVIQPYGDYEGLRNADKVSVVANVTGVKYQLEDMSPVVEQEIGKLYNFKFKGVNINTGYGSWALEDSDSSSDETR